MKAPLSWIKEFISIDLSIEELAYRMTMAGLEVEAIRYVGFPLPQGRTPGRKGGHIHPETKVSGFEWEREKIVVGAIHEVMPHPNADRLVLCRLDDGDREHTVLTGAPNLYPFKGKGQLEKPIKVAYAREGATIIDAYQPGNKTTRLKRRKIRGFESYSMACSERELGISDEHEGIILLDDDAPTGMPLVDYMGDAVFDIAITPNIVRAANILGIAREISALTGKLLHPPDLAVQMDGPPIGGQVSIEITDPELNPRFVLGLIRNVEIKPSPYRTQLRLRLAGQRPINNIVDVTNYAMLEVGEPLHAFDYDVLLRRAGGQPPTIVTRAAEAGERLTTLDNVERTLDDFTILVCDKHGPLALAGVMGGAESEVNENTRNVLLEGAAWNMYHTRRTVIAQKLPSEAAYRFSRGVHPEMAPRGVRRGLELMRQWSGGIVARGLVDAYPLPAKDPTVELSPEDVHRWLGIDLPAAEIADILQRLDFSVTVDGQSIRATTPDHRLDIGEGVIGKADLIEEIARMYGYDTIPETRLADELPPQRGNPDLEKEELVRDLLVDCGFQEVITYRMSTPDREALRLAPGTPPDDKPYLTLANPITSERAVMRHSLLASMLDIVERNARIRDRIALFEIGPVFLVSEGNDLPEERSRLVIALSGPRAKPYWQSSDPVPMDFFDLKGVVESLLTGLHIEKAQFEPGSHPSLHPGKCASIRVGERQLGVMGALHPQVAERYDHTEFPLFVAEVDMQSLFAVIPERFEAEAVPNFPPVIEDLALVMDESISAAQIEQLIRETGGGLVADVELFDLYQGNQIGAGQKSLAYRITYQAPNKTLTDKVVAKTRQRIVRRLEETVHARLRS